MATRDSLLRLIRKYNDEISVLEHKIEIFAKNYKSGEFDAYTHTIDCTTNSLNGDDLPKLLARKLTLLDCIENIKTRLR